MASVLGNNMGSSSSSIELMHFDSVAVANDHHFINKKPQNSSSNAKIMREWKILQENLPDSIYVQVYETRIDLLRAVIVGSPGTPYHDGLFFFDIFLPSDYPINPPHVYYHSHGYRLNPNLYADGKLCLSLINTWFGSKAEKWTRGSTILQLLVSIQGLVLNSRPYFNEPGYEKSKNSKSSRWIKASNRYNEGAFILSCMTMQHIIKHPPQNFEIFVAQHFRHRAAPLITAIDGYHQGPMLVGYLGMTPVSSSSNRIQISSRFKTNLERIRGHLELALASHSIPIPSRPIVASIPTQVESEKNHEKGLLKRITSFIVHKLWKKNK